MICWNPFEFDVDAEADVLTRLSEISQQFPGRRPFSDHELYQIAHPHRTTREGGLGLLIGWVDA